MKYLSRPRLKCFSLLGFRVIDFSSAFWSEEKKTVNLLNIYLFIHIYSFPRWLLMLINTNVPHNSNHMGIYRIT